MAFSFGAVQTFHRPVCRHDHALVSRVVTDLVAGAGLKFAECGPFDLKGIPGSWDLNAAVQ